MAPEETAPLSTERRGTAYCPIHSGNPRIVWFWAVLLAVGWYGLWCWLLRPAKAVSTAAPLRVPQVSYMRVNTDGRDGEALTADIRALWSPVLFSIPTPMGFSRSVLTNEVGVRPPLGQSMGFSNFLERSAQAVPASPLVVVPTLNDIVAEAMKSLTLDEAGSSPVTPVPAKGEEVQVELLQGLGERTPANMNLPHHPWIRGDKAWEIVLYVEFGADGIVRQVFIESPTESESLNAAMAQAAWKLRLDKQEAPVSGRIVVRNRGRTALTDGRQNGGGP